MKILVGGFFDILHSGHIFYLIKAKSLGSYLIVNISPDIRAKEKKGKGRPILSENERAFILNNIGCVDETFIGLSDNGMTEEDYQIKNIKKIKPDIFVRTTFNKKVNSFCEKNKVKMIVLNEISGIDSLHSTNIINKLNK